MIITDNEIFKFLTTTPTIRTATTGLQDPFDIAVFDEAVDKQFIIELEPLNDNIQWCYTEEGLDFIKDQFEPVRKSLPNDVPIITDHINFVLSMNLLDSFLAALLVDGEYGDLGITVKEDRNTGISTVLGCNKVYFTIDPYLAWCLIHFTSTTPHPISTSPIRDSAIFDAYGLPRRLVQGALSLTPRNNAHEYKYVVFRTKIHEAITYIKSMPQGM